MGKSWFAVVKKAFTPRPKQTKDEQVSTDPQTIFIIYIHKCLVIIMSLMVFVMLSLEAT